MKHQAAMRRAGNNPTDVEVRWICRHELSSMQVSDIINWVAVELENTSGYLDLQVNHFPLVFQAEVVRFL
jgi:hypothetical protein